MTKLTDADKLTLEQLIDKSTLAEVTDALAEIAHGKASHLRENWQDFDAAKLWDYSAIRLEVAASKSEI